MKAKLDLENTQVLDLMVEGKSVRVRVDAAGNPITVGTGCWIGGDDERIAKLAMEAAREMAIRRKVKQHHARRTEKSTRGKRNDTAKFWEWAEEWLAMAHRKHPDYGADRLAAAARQIIAWNGQNKDEYSKRDKITEYRAKQFLRNKTRGR